MNWLRKQILKIPKTRWGKQTFLVTQLNKKVLDVGCGNNSPEFTKLFCSSIYYVGVDVGDYNNSSASLAKADEYHVFSPEEFAKRIGQLGEDFDCVISNHNIEHCNKPDETICAMCQRLKPGGVMFLSFPNEESVNFPHRDGTLNFYDDNTHIYIPKMKKIIKLLENEDMRIIKFIKGYRPLYYRIIGRFTEPLSKKRGKIMKGTWAYWGFESIIWARKKQMQA